MQYIWREDASRRDLICSLVSRDGAGPRNRGSSRSARATASRKTMMTRTTTTTTKSSTCTKWRTAVRPGRTPVQPTHRTSRYASLVVFAYTSDPPLSLKTYIPQSWICQRQPHITLTIWLRDATRSSTQHAICMRRRALDRKYLITFLLYDLFFMFLYFIISPHRASICRWPSLL